MEHIHEKVMEERFSQVEASIESIDRKLSRVVDSLIGNELTKEKGWIDKLIQFEKEIESLKYFKQRIIWTVVLCGTIASILMAILQMYLNYIINIKH